MSSVAEIIAELDDHGFADTSSTRKVAIINDTIWDICSREPWPFLEVETDLTFDGISRNSIEFPADIFSSILRVLSIHDKTTGNPMRFYRNDEVGLLGSTATKVQAPFGFFFAKGDLSFLPIPPATTVLKARLLVAHSQLTSGSTSTEIKLPIMHHRAIVLGALWKLYDMEDDPELATRFEQHYENRINTMREELVRPQFMDAETINVYDDIDHIDFL